MAKLMLYVLLIAALFYYGIIYLNSAIVLLGYALMLLLVIEVVEVVYRMFTIKVSLQIPITMAEQNMPVSVIFAVKNHSPFPTGRLDIRMSIRNSLAKKGKTHWMSLPGVKKGKSKHDFQVVLYAAGSHEVELIKVRIYSVLGLVSLTKKCRDFGNILILPEIHATQIGVSEATHTFMGDSDYYDEFRPGHDPAETLEIRPYRPKDKLQSIHWKLSAKTEDLMVKEQSTPKACAIVLLLDLRPLSDREMADSVAAFIELAASISFCLIDSKAPHYVAWFSRETKDIRRIRVDDEESYYLFICNYLKDGMAVKDKNIRDEYREKYKNEYYLHDVCINNQFEVYKNGTCMYQLDEKKIKDECEKMELLL